MKDLGGDAWIGRTLHVEVALYALERLKEADVARELPHDEVEVAPNALERSKKVKAKPEEAPATQSVEVDLNAQE